MPLVEGENKRRKVDGEANEKAVNNGYDSRERLGAVEEARHSARPSVGPRRPRGSGYQEL